MPFTLIPNSRWKSWAALFLAQTTEYIWKALPCTSPVIYKVIMKAVVQRVIDASVSVDGVVKGSIASGLLIYLGVALHDTTKDADWIAEKAVNLRIFDDLEGKMNLSLLHLVNHDKKQVNEMVNQDISMVNVPINQENSMSNNALMGVLAISQFTLLGDARKGRRPSWTQAAPPEKARELYLYFIEKVREKTPCECGEFQAHMKVSYTNDGPVTVLLDSITNEK
jgi:D-tyrosyl-tRNA(Tyr) deacylase